LAPFTLLGAAAAVLLVSGPASAQTATSAAQQPATVTCVSTSTARQTCPANTSGGVALQQSTGTGACLLGKTWGYDDKNVWVSDGCGGIFALGQATPVAVAAQAATPPAAAGAPPGPALAPVYKEVETWGEFNPGKGFLVGRSDVGQLSISGYAMLRYMDQTPATQTFTDHLGNERTTDGRNDIYSHRVMIFFTGWLGSPKLIYAITLWTVNPTDQRA